MSEIRQEKSCLTTHFWTIKSHEKMKFDNAFADAVIKDSASFSTGQSEKMDSILEDVFSICISIAHRKKISRLHLGSKYNAMI